MDMDTYKFVLHMYISVCIIKYSLPHTTIYIILLLRYLPLQAMLFNANGILYFLAVKNCLLTRFALLANMKILAI